MEKKFYVGLDIGTDSVGWAVTDENYNLLKARGKDMWGSYLFDPAQTAVERRTYRVSRRRLERIHQRLMLLQELFAEEISKKDSTFFLRLNNSKFFVEDKETDVKTKNILFNDFLYSDKNFFKQYPTIFHLRSALLSGEVKDIRLLYLAIHHIIKNRGNFLFENQDFDINNTDAIKEKFFNINSMLKDFYPEGSSSLSFENLEEALKILPLRIISKKEKVKKLEIIFSVQKNKQLIAVINAIVGLSVNLKDLYKLEKNYTEISKFSFDKDSFEETDFPLIEENIGIEKSELVLTLKSIYDWSLVCNILNGKEYISQSKVEVFDQHKKDLLELKKYIRDNCPEKYPLVFRHKNKINNYAAYIGMDKQHGYKKCSKDDFYAFLKKEINISNEDILTKIDNGDFLPKQISNANGVIPYQINLRELKAILKNASKYFSFLNEKSDGYTISEKIIMLMTFRIPYYVGPLNNYHGKFSWVKKYEGTDGLKITPWNFDKIIDKDACEDAFIKRMTNKCTYLIGEDVLPASSLIYSEFSFLNELNNLKINGVKDDKAKELIYQYAKTHKKITQKTCLKLLIDKGVLPKDSKAVEVFSGIEEDFKNSLSSYIDLKKILGDKVDKYPTMCEDIILWITIVSDKMRLIQRIKNNYGKILSNEEIKNLKGLNYKSWGRLSKKLLCQVKCANCVDENGEALSILQKMRSSTLNFMQLLSNDFGFTEEINRINAESNMDEGVTYRTVENLYCSPAVKRAIWRTIVLLKEVIKIEGNVPKKVFIEMARDVNDDTRKGKRTISRKQQIIDLYKNIKSESIDWQKQIEATEDSKFNSDKLVLYYRQMGKSMYSEKSIKLEEVFKTNICDIDHIYPQSKIKDDSLDNRVLVFKNENANKQDIYPLPEDIRMQRRAFWTQLKDNNLISEEKYNRLIRNTPLSTAELADFINRQLVETRQSTKAVADILRKMLPNSEVVYAKAKNASDFKQENGIIKVRELNDLHHAKDAYINIVVGNVYNTKFNHNAFIFFKNNNYNSYNLKYLYAKDIEGAWKVSEKQKIINTVNKDTCSIVRFTSEGKGGFFDATIKTAGENECLIPLKQNGPLSNVSKYGGYDSASTAYFMLVKSDGEKDEKILSLETVPIFKDKKFEVGLENPINYCINELKLKNPQILIKKIKLNTLFCINGSYAYIRGKTNNRIVWCNANQLRLDYNSIKYLKNISNYFEDRKKLMRVDLPVGQKINKEDNLKLYDVLVEKLSSKIYSGLNISLQANVLIEKRECFINLSLKEQCEIIMEVLHFMQCNSVHSNLSIFGLAKSAGTVLTSKNIQNKKIKMIEQSTTGYYNKITNFSDFL